MKPIDFLIIAILVLVAAGAVYAIWRSKKSGKKCIGCPESGKCGRKCSCCGGCEEK